MESKHLTELVEASLDLVDGIGAAVLTVLEDISDSWSTEIANKRDRVREAVRNISNQKSQS